MMAKTANLYARIEPDVKEQAEMILTALGIPASNAINMFYKQIILQGGLPFDVKLPTAPLDCSKMTKEEFDSEIGKGLADVASGNVISAEDVFSELHKKYGI
ncbi:MAG: type II toxin-antitoxin system RelB/DinJ family antitoxin [Ruminococcaceae bacterium]|nr:type II toxin-antitoxin system RelB/DinJ family antitoxin [Oscillospiraceae bacterium]